MVKINKVTTKTGDDGSSKIKKNKISKDDAMFSNFYAPRGTRQHIALSSLREKSHQSVFLSGPLGTGLSHLLQAACRQEQDSIYLPLGHVAKASPENLFDKLEMHRLVCLDDLQTVITKNTWQHSVFKLFKTPNPGPAIYCT
mgnify:CR=1 FL=1